jgi:glutamate formiminotransferase/formiminotetrahydrofolate cyclodeaminase
MTLQRSPGVAAPAFDARKLPNANVLHRARRSSIMASHDRADERTEVRMSASAAPALSANALCECVPNFSEGRDRAKVDRIVAAMTAVAGVHCLDVELDGDHNRCVITLAGHPTAIAEAAFHGAALAMKEIDLTTHKGEHPRMGATDVIPFIPISDCTEEDLIPVARALGKRMGDELKLPVFFYESAATNEERRSLAKVRKGQFEGLRDLIGTDETRTPDAGPNAIHPTAGCTAVGVRFWLIAYNVNLATTNLQLAKDIANAIREAKGGLPGIRAMGFELAERKCVQVSMNVVDYRKTSLTKVYGEIERLATEAGVEIIESELVGLIPQDAINSALADRVKLTGFNAKQVIENLIAEQQGGNVSASSENVLRSTLPFVEALASGSPTPGGGGAAALNGALGAALGSMVANLTIGRKKYADVEAEATTLLATTEAGRVALFNAIERDATAFDGYMAAMKLPKESDEQKAARASAMHDELLKAARVPMEIAELAASVLPAVERLADIGNKNAISDCAVGAACLRTAIQGACLNVEINLSMMKDCAEKTQLTDAKNRVLADALSRADAIVDKVRKSLT